MREDKEKAEKSNGEKKGNLFFMADSATTHWGILQLLHMVMIAILSPFCLHSLHNITSSHEQNTFFQGKIKIFRSVLLLNVYKLN